MNHRLSVKIQTIFAYGLSLSALVASQLLVSQVLGSQLMAQKPTDASASGEQGAHGDSTLPENVPPWRWDLELTAEQFQAMQPLPPAGPPNPGNSGNAGAVASDAAVNLFGTRFPWADARVAVRDGEENRSLAGRLRYDGDFTYMMSANGPKRPMLLTFSEADEGKSSSYRLLNLMFDPTRMRQRVAAEIYANLQVPTATAHYVELNLSVEGTAVAPLGLYLAVPAVEGDLLRQFQLSEDSLLIQTNGLNSLNYQGENWGTYAVSLRLRRPANLDEQKRILDFLRLIGKASDEEFQTGIESYLDVDSFLRYLAATTITSNLTGFSTIGTNDLLCLDRKTKQFHVLASEMETSLGGAVLSGTPEQLAELDIRHPYAGNCLLVERILKVEEYHAVYRKLLEDACQTSLTEQRLMELTGAIEEASAAARARDEALTESRSQGNQNGGPGPGGMLGDRAMAPLEFLSKRRDAILAQLSTDKQGYTPKVPDFNGAGFGGPRRQGASAPISEEEFRDSVEVPSPFLATLYATSPEVSYPVAIATEPSGAVYVASDQQGSLGTDKGGGRVLRCVDHDADGHVDRVTVFCEVDHVRGVCYRDGNVWVCHPPFLTLFRDEDGDGVADWNQQLVRGLTTELVDTRGGDHTTNGIRMGIDGWIYIGCGDYGVPAAEGVDGSKVVLRGGGILRVRPDGTELELYCSGLRNPFDIAIDPQLNLFTRDNTNDGGGWDTRVSQLFATAEYGYPRLFANFSDEIMPPLGSYGGGGGTGSLYIEHPNWPAPYNRSLFTGDWGRSAVFHHPLEPTGPSFAVQQRDFVSVPRATGMDLDVNGNLYLASWWSGEASVYVGPHVGFVTRVTPTELASDEFPELRSLETKSLLQLLARRNAVARFHAQGEILRRGNQPEVVDGLLKVIDDEHFLLEGRIAALFALKQIQGPASHGKLKELTNDPKLREFAIRALADRVSEMGDLDAEFFAAFLADESDRVKAQAIIALGRLKAPHVAPRLLALAEISGIGRPDASQADTGLVIPHLALRALIAIQAEEACLKEVTGENWRSAIRVLRNLPTVAVADGLMELAATVNDEQRRHEVLVALMRLYQRETPYDGSWWGIRPDTTGPSYDPKPWEKSSQIASVLQQAIAKADPESQAILKAELLRHQIVIPGMSDRPMPGAEIAEQPIEVQPVDPQNPNQIGNLEFEQVLARAMAKPGSIDRGAELFQKRSCVACHTADSGQKPLGPHLADIGKRYQGAELVESIVKPSEKIAQGYETQLILLASGEMRVGFVVGENGGEIQLRTREGQTYRIARSEIEERKRETVSSMPEGLVGSLTPEDLADLLAYLKSL